MLGESTRSHPETFRPWREQLLRRILYAALGVGAVALVPSVIASCEAAVWSILVGDFVAYATVCVLAFFPGIPYAARAGTFILVTYVLGSMLLLLVGTEAASFLWLAAPSLLAVLLLDRAILVATAGLTLVTIGVATLLLFLGVLPWSVPASVWFALLGNFAALTVMIVAATSFLLDRLVIVIERERRLNDEKGALFAEMHHRVKNNLQLMASLLHLQAASGLQHGARNAVLTSEARVRSMGLVHEAMFGQQDQQGVDIVALLPGFVDDLVAVFGEATVRVETEVGPAHLRLPVDRAIPFGLVVQELISAAMRERVHGSCPGVRVGLRRVDDEIELTVECEIPSSSRRHGPPALADPDVTDALVCQLGGKLAFSLEGHRSRATLRTHLGDSAATSLEGL